MKRRSFIQLLGLSSLVPSVAPLKAVAAPAASKPEIPIGLIKAKTVLNAVPVHPGDIYSECIAAPVIVYQMWDGQRWLTCDGLNGTIDLRDIHEQHHTCLPYVKRYGENDE